MKNPTLADVAGDGNIRNEVKRAPGPSWAKMAVNKDVIYMTMPELSNPRVRRD